MWSFNVDEMSTTVCFRTKEVLQAPVGTKAVVSSDWSLKNSYV